MFSKLKRFILGVPLNPLHPSARHSITLIALLAWVGLGADPLSSSCYGPEEAFLALGQHSSLALYVAAITVVTIFIISFGYNQVIELFPNGGGGYQVATKLLHPYLGLVSGCALIIDYILTIAVSISSGTDAVFSFLPPGLNHYKLYIEAIFIVLLLVLNLRGMKETIKILLPVFLGFVVTHFTLIIYGIVAHSQGLFAVVPNTLHATRELATNVGWLAVLGLVLHAYSLGSGTYTGLESISNNVQRLAEPRIQTGKRAMLYMAISLSFTAGGIILLYLLWHVQPEAGKTLNAVVFQSILGNSWLGHALLILTLQLEACLLLIAANAGFVAGPNVLAYMAIDGWVPNRFRHLSSRLVVQNGAIFFGIAALLVLLWTRGSVAMLVVLYSINVFITFSLSLLGICVYWVKHRATSAWRGHFGLTFIAFLLTSSILCITLFYKFLVGGWFTILMTSSLIVICLGIKSHYNYVARKLRQLDRLLQQPIEDKSVVPCAINPKDNTAVIYINNMSVGMHTLLSVLRLFPNQFKNFVFLSAGTVDAESFGAQQELENMQAEVNNQLDYFVRFCWQNGLPAEAYAGFGTDTIGELKNLTDLVSAKYPNSIFFASQLIFAHDNLATRFLHNQTPLLLQHHLHFMGKELMIMPMKI